MKRNLLFILTLLFSFAMGLSSCKKIETPPTAGDLLIWALILFVVAMLAFLLFDMLFDFINRNEIKRGKERRKRFRTVGNMTGMHRNSIIQIVGEPSRISTEYYGTLLTWGEIWEPDTCIYIKFDHNGYFINVGMGDTFQSSVS